jgi:hypothetical protein
MKRTCFGCCAWGGPIGKCELGYAVRLATFSWPKYGMSIEEGIPMEQCPKPKTITKYIELRKQRREI